MVQNQKIWKLILLLSLTFDMYTHIQTHFAQQSLIFSLFSISVSDINVLLKIKMLISLSMELGVRVLFHHCMLSSLNISPSSHLIFFFSLKIIPQVGENFIEMDTSELSFQDLTYHWKCCISNTHKTPDF